MLNKNQWEELHIASETTSDTGKQSESRQSGAEHPNEETTSAQQGGSKTRPSESANKYNHTIFAGWAGENYLSWILKQILPYALWRTWWSAVSFQAPGNTCYVGTTAIARQEKPSVRKIEMDLAEFEARGLMERYPQRQAFPQEDGTVVYGTVTVKDFSKLYDLAYEYHLWINCPQHVEASWGNAETIKQDTRLYLKLMRFDNYHHILTCQKPGPKAKRTPLQEIYHCQLPEELSQQEEAQGSQPARTGDPKANLYLNPSENVSSPYRESKNQESYLSKENSTSKKNLEERGFADVVSTAIRNNQQSDQAETDAKEQVVNEIEEEEQLKQEQVRRRDQSNTIEAQQKEEIGRETVKEEKEYTIEDLKQNPMAMITFLLQLNEQEQQQAKSKKRHHKDQPKRKRLSTPEQLARTITQMVQDLGGNPQYLQSDITRVTKIYWACTQIFHPFSNVWFLEQLTKAYVKTCKARKVSKRVPYFFTTLQNILELTSDEIAYIRSQEALYRDGDLKTFVLGLQHLYEKSGSLLEYQEWVKQTYL
jgi:hypothetical protein